MLFDGRSRFRQHYQESPANHERMPAGHARAPPIAPVLGTTVAALESDGGAASDYIFLRTASVLLSPSASPWLSQ